MFKLTFKQQVLTGFAISLLFVLVSAVTSYFSIRSVDIDSDWENHTYDFIDRAERLEVKLLNAETGLRGFILTGDKKYLQPYEENIGQIDSTMEDLRRMSEDNTSDDAQLDSVQLYSTELVRDMRKTLEVYNSEGKIAATNMILTDRGRDIKYKFLYASSNLIKAEKEMLKLRTKTREESTQRSTIVITLSSAIIFGLILYLFSFIQRTFDTQKVTEEQIRKNNTQLERLSEENEKKNWLLSGAAQINEAMSGEQEIEELTGHIITHLCNYVNAPVGALYLVNTHKQTLSFSNGYAWDDARKRKKDIALGQGLVGQAALEQKSKSLHEIPEDYIQVSTGLGSLKPTELIIVPVLFQDETIAVIEIGLLRNAAADTMNLISTVIDAIGVGINSAQARTQLRELFLQTQQQAEELESQQEELRTTNEELLHKSEELQASEEELRVQQEELRQTNAELEEKASLLEERNISITEAREAMSLKAEELAVSSRYKSEFLANMSHELRTPLNSILILARILKENRPENLNEEQIKYAGVIHNAGSDLLTLINDILDLSKIESGKVDLDIEPVRPEEITRNMESLFSEIAKSKKITFRTIIDPSLPPRFMTDLSRTEQIIKNLLSNAFKFTPENGDINLEISKAPAEHTYYAENLQTNKDEIISFSVKDSGIGIPSDKQKLIFEAFKQADGTTSRKYGGTGLGLSISKELSHILGGEIQVESEPGTGSIFTLYLPAEQTGEERLVPAEQVKAPLTIPLVPEQVLQPVNQNRKQTLLIVEDDLTFADVLKDYAIEKGFEPLLAHSGDIGLEMAQKQLPDAIILDIMLPVMDGWTILKKLKSNPQTKDIPVHMMSAGEFKSEKALQEGAIGFLKKPIEKDQLDQAFQTWQSENINLDFNSVLVIEDHELQSMAVKEQLTERGIDVVQAFTGEAALELVNTRSFDCIILDLNLPDISGFDLLDQIKQKPDYAHIPVIINTAMELDQDSIAHIMKYTEAMVLKSNKSNDRLIDEVSLFMHKLKKQEKFQATAKSPAQGKTISTIEKALQHKTVLITDDDMRNIFALSSALQVYDMKIVIATNGKEALEKLDEVPDIDIVLMDIMMPEMDGYEAMRLIRKDKAYKKLPIIALTAKAMKNDREKCIEAGANDYIAKPVDVDQLLSMLRVWLS